MRRRQHPDTASGGENRTATASDRRNDQKYRRNTVWKEDRREDVDNLVDVDEDVVKIKPKSLSDYDTSAQLGSLSASTQYFLEPGFYTLNFCCVVDPQGGPRGEGVKNYFCAKRVKMQ